MGGHQGGVERRGTHRVVGPALVTESGTRRPPYAGTPRGDREAAMCHPGWPCLPAGLSLGSAWGWFGGIAPASRWGGPCPCPTHSPQIAFHPPGRGHHEYLSTPGSPGVSCCSWRCWWLAAPLARGFARHRLAPRGFEEGTAIQPRKMHFSSRLSRVFLPPRAVPLAAGTAAGQRHRLQSRLRRSSQNSLIS